ncbi:hypothetical protein AXF42_Ash008840 [Apostasia shenzhenica]|uniref:BED-type domain-containing protein n=1 Tax=Apostasia shenzhenica TaxID=1088818 RepID=A0A2I0ASM6_9ASPA|nr:hypothetical protein AXF42_Ash008840 [Apostasia shenzhenica]
MSIHNSVASILSSQDSIEPSPSLATLRQKIDITWKYVTDMRTNDGKKWLKCDFCEESFKGDGIHRVKMHLTKRKGDVEICKPEEIRFKVEKSIKEVKQLKRKKANYEEEFSQGNELDSHGVNYSGHVVAQSIGK